MECQIVFSVSFILCAPHVAKQQGSAHFVTIKPDLWAKFLQGFVKKLVMTGLVSWLAESFVLIVERGMPLVLCCQLFAIVL